MIVIEFGYTKYIMPKDMAMQMVDILEKAEVYEAKYWNTEERKARGIPSDYTHHVYANEKQYNMQIVSDQMYEMAKLAGKPEGK